MKIANIFLLSVILCAFTIMTTSCNTTNIANALITHFEWGKIVVNATEYRDCRIWPNHHEEWNWNKTGTRHVPGTQIADLTDFIDNVDVIILSEGVDGVLQIKDETITYLEGKNIKIYRMRTPEAVKLYNELAAQKIRVGALLHSTC